MSKIQYWQW